jgi:hypothetical protein
MRITRPVVAASIAVLLMLSACSSSKSSSTTTTASGANSTVGTNPASGGGGGGGGAVAASLLTPSELGTGGFTAASFAPGAEPLPCDATGSPAFDTANPADQAVYEVLSNPDGSKVREELRGYARDPAATKAYDAYAKGLSCRESRTSLWSGTSAKVTIGAKDTQGVTADQNESHTLSMTGAGGIVIVARRGSLLATLWFFVPEGVDPLNLGDANVIANKALDKAG